MAVSSGVLTYSPTFLGQHEGGVVLLHKNCCATLSTETGLDHTMQCTPLAVTFAGTPHLQAAGTFPDPSFCNQRTRCAEQDSSPV